MCNIKSSSDQVVKRGRFRRCLEKSFCSLPPLSPTRPPSRWLPWAVGSSRLWCQVQCALLFYQSLARRKLSRIREKHRLVATQPQALRNWFNRGYLEALTTENGSYCPYREGKWRSKWSHSCGLCLMPAAWSLSLALLKCFPLPRFHSYCLIKRVFKDRCWATHLPYIISFNSLTI